MASFVMWHVTMLKLTSEESGRYVSWPGKIRSPQFIRQNVELWFENIKPMSWYDFEHLAQPCQIEPGIERALCGCRIIFSLDRNNLVHSKLDTTFAQTIDN